MNYQHIVSTLLELVGSGLGVWGITEIVKKVPRIPINDGQKVRIRSFAGILSALAVLAIGFTNNDSLKPDDLQGAILAILGFLGTFGTAHVFHHTVGKD